MGSNPMPMMAHQAEMSMMGGMGMGMGGMGMGGMGMGGMQMGGGMPGFMGPWTQMSQMQSPLSNQIPGVGYMNNGQVSVYPQHHPSISAMHPKTATPTTTTTTTPADKRHRTGTRTSLSWSSAGGAGLLECFISAAAKRGRRPSCSSGARRNIAAAASTHAGR